MLDCRRARKHNDLQRAIVTLWNTTLESREIVSFCRRYARCVACPCCVVARRRKTELPSIPRSATTPARTPARSDASGNQPKKPKCHPLRRCRIMRHPKTGERSDPQIPGASSIWSSRMPALTYAQYRKVLAGRRAKGDVDTRIRPSASCQWESRHLLPNPRNPLTPKCAESAPRRKAALTANGLQ